MYTPSYQAGPTAALPLYLSLLLRSASTLVTAMQPPEHLSFTPMRNALADHKPQPDAHTSPQPPYEHPDHPLVGGLAGGDQVEFGGGRGWVGGVQHRVPPSPFADDLLDSPPDLHPSSRTMPKASPSSNRVPATDGMGFIGIARPRMEQQENGSSPSARTAGRPPPAPGLARIHRTEGMEITARQAGVLRPLRPASPPTSHRASMRSTLPVLRPNGASGDPRPGVRRPPSDAAPSARNTPDTTRRAPEPNPRRAGSSEVAPRRTDAASPAALRQRTPARLASLEDDPAALQEIIVHALPSPAPPTRTPRNQWASRHATYPTVTSEIRLARASAGVASAGAGMAAAGGAGVGLGHSSWGTPLAAAGGGTLGTFSGLSTYFHGRATSAADGISTAQKAEIGLVKHGQREMLRQEQRFRGRVGALERARGWDAAAEHVHDSSPLHHQTGENGTPALAWEPRPTNPGILQYRRADEWRSRAWNVVDAPLSCCGIGKCVGCEGISIAGGHDKRLRQRGASTPYDHDEALAKVKAENRLVQKELNEGLRVDGIKNQVGFKLSGVNSYEPHDTDPPIPFAYRGN